MTRVRVVVLLVLVLGQAALASTVFNPAPHPGGDNAGYVALAHSLATGQGYVESWDPATPTHTKYPPVFPLLLSLLIRLGATTWSALKLVGVASSLVVTGATFLWASRRAGTALGAGVALLTGFSWSVLWHAGLVLSDVPFLAFTMLSLWAIEEVLHPGAVDESRAKEASPTGPVESTEPPAPRRASLFLGVAIAAALLAWFTRSAGLPLVVAILGALLLRKRTRDALLLGGIVGVPALVWLVRGATAGSDEGRYASEFFLVNPYDPGLGRAGIGDFVQRLSENASGYVGRFIPQAFSGTTEGPAVAIVLVVLLLALTGWGIAIRKRRGAAELFVPMYLGLILIWPSVWSGDRFALPLLPLLLLFAAEGARELGDRLRPGAGAIGAGVIGVAMLLPMIGGWRDEVARVEVCREAVAEVGPWGCSGQATLAFATLAEWTGSAFPAETAMLTRKPRIFHVLSGLTSRTYPFDDDPAVLFEDAGAIGARHVILDGIGSTGMRYVGGAVSRHPDRFCQVVGLGAAGTPGQTILLGILPEGADAAATEGESIRLARCPEELGGAEVGFEPTLDGTIPLLVRRDGQVGTRP